MAIDSRIVVGIGRCVGVGVVCCSVAVVGGCYDVTISRISGEVTSNFHVE